MKRTFIITAMLGAITQHAMGATTCGAVKQSTYIGYSIYSSEYSDVSRCKPGKVEFYYFYEPGSTLCPIEYTRKINVSVLYASQSDNDQNSSLLGTSHVPIYGYQTCKECASGYNQILIARLYDTNTVDTQFYEIYGCGLCSETAWERFGNYEQRTICTDIDTTGDTIYRCANGFYGTNRSCAICPVLENGQSSPAFARSIPGENEYITDCYLEPGEYRDTTGTFTIEEDCHYVE